MPASRLLPCLLSLCAAAGPQAWAAPSDNVDLTDLPIEQLLNLEVVTASKIPQKLSDVPATVSVITADDIRHYGYRTLADILRSVRGIHVTYDRSYEYVGTRGLGRPGDFNTRILILIDGKRLNDAVYDLGAVGGEFPIDTEMIERVEFVPGPGSAIYGSSAFFGVVNVITKSAAGTGRSEIGLARGSHDSTRGRFATSLKLGGKADLLLSVSGMYSRGQDLYFPEFDDGPQAPDGGWARGLDDERYRRFFAKLGWGPLTLEAYAGRRIKGVPTAAFGQQFGRAGSLTADEYAVMSGSWQAPLSPSWQLYAGLSVNRYRYWADYLYDWSETINHDQSESRTLNAELRVLSTAWRDHRVVAGIEAVRDSHARMRNYDTAPLATYLDIDAPRSRFGVYLQDDIRLGERFGLNVGMRHDRDKDGGSTNSPRVALLYKPVPQLTFKALAGRAFRAANAYERYYETESEYKRNPGVRSERIRTGELSVEYFPTNTFRASAAVYQYRVTDLLALALDPADGMLYFSNIEGAHSRGIELEGEWLDGAGGRLKTSLSLQRARDDAGAWLSNAPRRLAKLNYSAPLWGDKLRASAELQATSRRRTPLGAEVGGFGVANLTLITRIGRDLELSASVYNLFDKRHADGPSEEHFDNSDPPRYLTAITQPRRHWQLRLNYGFR